MTAWHECELVKCEGCGYATCTEDLSQDIDGQFCEHCANELTLKCTICDVRAFPDDMVDTGGDDATVCLSCSRDLA